MQRPHMGNWMQLRVIQAQGAYTSVHGTEHNTGCTATPSSTSLAVSATQPRRMGERRSTIMKPRPALLLEGFDGGLDDPAVLLERGERALPLPATLRQLRQH